VRFDLASGAGGCGLDSINEIGDFQFIQFEAIDPQEALDVKDKGQELEKTRPEGD